MGMSHCSCDAGFDAEGIVCSSPGRLGGRIRPSRKADSSGEKTS
jgi:hypothetical protein